MKKWLIWNFERGAWWMGDRDGYTKKIEVAGRFAFDEAREICQSGNIHLGVSKDEGLKCFPQEAMVEDDWSYDVER